MDKKTLLIMTCSVLMSVTGQFLLKKGAATLGPIGLDTIVQKLFVILFQPYIFSGLFIYSFAAVGFIIVLSRADLSVVSPFIATSYIFTVLGGSLLFGEELTSLRLVGVGLIMLGVTLVLRSG